MISSFRLKRSGMEKSPENKGDFSTSLEMTALFGEPIFKLGDFCFADNDFLGNFH